jgi:hypothetical protein
MANILQISETLPLMLINLIIQKISFGLFLSLQNFYSIET